MNRIEHNSKEYIFPYVEYSPDNAGENMPLVIQLHGAGERGCGGGMAGMPRHLISLYGLIKEHRTI